MSTGSANGSLEWLQGWYLDNCDGDWEHSYGVRLETLDNPGWRLRVDLTGTALEEEPFDPLTVDRSERDWLHVRVVRDEVGNAFEAACGPRNLAEVLRVFRVWVEETGGATHAGQEG